MSGNLTKYEQLQHRHLSLLRALQDQGITAKCDHHGDWHVKFIGREMPTIEDIARKHPTFDEWNSKGQLDVSVCIMDDDNPVPVPYSIWLAQKPRSITKEDICNIFGVPHWVLGPQVDEYVDKLDWKVDVRKLYKWIAPPLPGTNAALDHEYRLLRDAHAFGYDTIMASRIPAILSACSDPLKFVAKSDQEPFDKWAMTLSVAGEEVEATFSDGTRKRVEKTPFIRDLMHRLRSVIVSAPAKA